MEISVPSRFAILPIEDDDMRNAPKSKDIKKKAVKPAASISKKNEKPAKNDKNKTNAKKTGNVSTKSKKKQANTQQWDEWMERDSELVNGHFEEDLQNAILLSKLEYEENEVQRKDTKEGDKTKLGKKKKSKAMSLDQFLHPDKKAEEAKEPLQANKDANFFDGVKSDAKAMANKEKVTEQRKKREQNIDEVISIANVQAKLELERSKNQLMQVQFEKLKTEIEAVKRRNQTLCAMLKMGEMKDKADILLEVERLNAIKNDYIDEIARLNAELKLEKSKSAAQINGTQGNKEKVKETKINKKKRNNKKSE